jgi:guanylate kinase
MEFLRITRAGALEHQELMSEGKILILQRCSSLKDLPSRRKQRENDREHVAEKLQRRLAKFNRFSQNGVFCRDNRRQRLREVFHCIVGAHQV